MRVFSSAAVLLLLTGIAYAIPPTLVEAGKIAIQRVPGTIKATSQYDDVSPFEVTILDKTGHECIVVVDSITGAIKKVSVPTLAKKEAITIALKKVKGKYSVQEEKSHFEPGTGLHLIVLDKKDGTRTTVSVSDKTRRVVKVETRSGDVG